MIVLPALLLALAPTQDLPWARAPLNYGERPTNDRVAQLIDKIEQGEVTLERDGDLGPLLALLAALQVPVGSQTTVFSRTSFQFRHISPNRPRALYFTDDVYVGYVPGTGLLELTAMDPEQGPIFYSARDDGRSLTFKRETHACLQCHAPSWNGELPAHLVRSVHPAADGTPVLRAGARYVQTATPYEERWGGWYVTGDTGDMEHLGNRTLGEDQERLEPRADLRADLVGLCDTDVYPVATSDVVALLVLEHQTHVQDVLSTAGYEARRALYDKVQLNRALEVPEDTPVHSTEVRLNGAAGRVARALLMAGEPRLPCAVGADSPFTAEFEARAVRDPKGRSLRDLDLGRRIFEYPLSYLIQTPTFDGLPAPLRERVWKELWAVLNGERDEDPDYSHISPRDCKVVREILAGTRDDLPDYWSSGLDQAGR